MSMWWLWLLFLLLADLMDSPLAAEPTSNEEILLPSYNICNGMSFQLLEHASAIAWFLQYQNKYVIVIPDYFIVDSASPPPPPPPTNQQGTGHGDAPAAVTPTPTNSIPLSSVFDTQHLVTSLQGLGASHVQLGTWDFSQTATIKPCIQFRRMAKVDPQLVLQVLRAFRPSAVVQKMVDTILSTLPQKMKSSSNTISQEGVCLHHRDGQDWHDNCVQWAGSKTYRGNCLGVLPHQTFVASLQVRGLLPPSSSSSSSSSKDSTNSDGTGTTSKNKNINRRRWAYYIGDHQVPQELQHSKAGFEVVSRLDLDFERDPVRRAVMAKIIALDKTTTSSPGRGIWPLVNYFVCQNFETFVGNSASTFSALQIALRGGTNTYWYNSQGIPLSSLWKVFSIPLVYTYTELSQSLGKSLLQTSITTARHHMPTTPIHILYHGTKDTIFREWLAAKNVILHQHDPVWGEKIEEMRTMGNKASSHLFLHAGNFFGTWQRIDIPLFLNSEYCLYLDADTVIARPFTMADFGLDLTYGLAMSDEADLNGQPFNAGVTLMNVPLLRETHKAYLEFIWANVISGGQFDGTNAPSDQGAALVFFQKHLRFLEREFNMKPYWPTSAVNRDPFIWHFHGAKPQDYMTYALGNPCPQAYQHICRQVDETPNVCAAFQAFGRAIIEADILDDFCKSSFLLVQENATKCSVMVQKMSREGEPCHDMKRKVNHLFAGHELSDDVIDSRDQTQWYPDVYSWPASLSWGFTLHCCLTGTLLIYVLYKNWIPRHDPNRILVVGRKQTRALTNNKMAKSYSKPKRAKASTNNASATFCCVDSEDEWQD